MLSQLIQFLNQPFPDSQDTDKWKSALLIGAFIASFLYVFKPFNLENAGHETWVVCLGFGLITFLVIIFIKVVTGALGIREDLDSWIFWKWLLSTLATILVIAIANYVYIKMLYRDLGGVIGFVSMLFSTFLLSIFPLIFIGSIRVVRNRLRYENISKDLIIPHITRQDRILKIKDAEGGIALEISSEDFLYAEAQHNYVTISYSKENSLQQCKFRQVFKNLEIEICDKDIIRCHRSFIINTGKIEEVSGNAQGLRLKLDTAADLIPVSRKYIPVIRQKLA